MSRYKRLYLPGGSFFFTLALARRGDHLLTDHVDQLRAAYGAVFAKKPFRTDAIVVMPDHIHAVWTLPPGESDYSTRWKLIKAGFSKRLLRGGLAPTLHMSVSKARKGEVGIWQRRFWEHTIRDQSDFDAHVEYCHFNPVKHGFVERAQDWPYSSVHRVLVR